MKKTALNILLLLLFAPFLVQCASQTDLEDLRYQLRIVNKKLEDMKYTTVGDLQKRQAAASGQMDQLEEDILKLKGQLEESYHLNESLKEQNKELEASISNVAQTEASKREEALKQFEENQREKEQRLTEALNEKLRQQQESVKAIQQARIREAELRAKEAALSAELAKTRARSAHSNLQSSGSTKHIQPDQKKIKLTEKSTQAASSSQSAAVTPQRKDQSSKQQSTVSNTSSSAADNTQGIPLDDFKKAQKLYENERYKDAYQLFEQIAKNPSDNNSVEARFMMGECLFQQREYDKAIMQYQNIISQHADNAKSAQAMLKQGMAFEKLADKDTAKVIYKKLLKKYSSSPEAATAQERLSKL